MARSRDEILRDMLAIALERVNKTAIMYKANLSYPQLIGHLKYLVDKKMIIKLDGLYVTNGKGRAYITAYEKMQEIIAENSEMRLASAS